MKTMHPTVSKTISRRLLAAMAIPCLLALTEGKAQVADSTGYMAELKTTMANFTTRNNNINLVFHGHSVPAGYWAQSVVHTFESYPHLLLKRMNAAYPHAVINVIVSARGSETAERGQLRLASDALNHKPDVLFIDYALNDIGSAIERTKLAWEKMIEEALKAGVKVVLLTPSPDQRHPVNDSSDVLYKHAQQIRQLAAKYKVGLVDSYAAFQQIEKTEGSIVPYMSHVNHPNEKGHAVIANAIFSWFRKK